MTQSNYGNFEYSMPKELAKTILEDRKKEDKKIDQQQYLCWYVNTTCCLKGTCIGVKLV